MAWDVGVLAGPGGEDHGVHAEGEGCRRGTGKDGKWRGREEGGGLLVERRGLGLGWWGQGGRLAFRPAWPS